MENIRILKHIYLDKSFLFFLIIVILTGNFNQFLPFCLLLIIHEMGHAITGITLGYHMDKIIIYPYGGITKFNLPLNILIKRELLILIMGPIFQIVGYLILKNYFGNISIYHYSLLLFNLLPIYPLDGGKILNAFLGIFNPYMKSFYFTFYLSIFFILLLLGYNIYYFNLNLFLMTIILLVKLIKVYQKRYYYYNRFLLERYLNNYNFKKIRNINDIHSLYRDTMHFINFQKEKDYLKKYFSIKK